MEGREGRAGKERTQSWCVTPMQVQRAESKRLRIEARLRPACWDLQQEFAADWKAMPAMAEGVQAFLMHAVALPYGSSVSLPPYWALDTGDDEPHGDDGTGNTSIPAHESNELRLTGPEIASAAKLAKTAACVERSLLLGTRMWADTNYDALAAALRPRRPPLKDDYVPPGRGVWHYGGLHDAVTRPHTSSASAVTPPFTETLGDRGPPLPNGGSPCPEAVLQHLACGAHPSPPREAPPREAPPREAPPHMHMHMYAPQPCGSGYDPRHAHAPCPLYLGPYGTPPPPRLPPQPPQQHPHPHLHQQAHLRLLPFQAPFVPQPHPHPSEERPPSHMHCSLHPAPPHHAPPQVEWNARPAPSEQPQPQPQPQPPFPPSAPQQPELNRSSSPSSGTAAVQPVGWGGQGGAGGKHGGRGCDGWDGGGRCEERSLHWEQRGRGRSRSRSSSPSSQGRSLHRRRRSPPSSSRSHSHSRGGRRSPHRQWDSDRSPIGRDSCDHGRDRGSERRGRECRRV